jgi:hypothetical protein
MMALAEGTRVKANQAGLHRPEHTTFQGYALVACATLRHELRYLREAGFLDVDRVLYTGPGLHTKPNELERQLTRQLQRAKESSPRVIVVYGSRCYIGDDDPTRTIDDIIGSARVSRIAADGCIDMLCAAEERERIAEGENIFWMSPGWIENWKRIYQRYLGWDAADANMNFPGFYRKAIFLDPQPLGMFDDWIEHSPERILEFSDWTQLVVDRHPVTLDRLSNLLLQCIDEGERTGRRLDAPRWIRRA